jgi:hypothetical protein
MMPRAIWLLIVGLLLIAGAYALAFAGNAVLAPWPLALGAAEVLAAMLWLGARRAGRLPRILGGALAIAAIATAGGFAWALLAVPPAAGGPLLFGLPRTTTLMLLLAGAVPLLVLPVAYTIAFDREVLDDDSLRRVREASER